jgi:hypothetical protein
MADYLDADRRKPDGEALRKAGTKWIERIEAAGKLEKTWTDDAERAVSAYTGEAADGRETAGLDFNILFANVETIVPAIINSPPQPDIRRRFADEDEAAKDVSELLERSIRVQVDDSRLQIEMEAAAHDAFLAGRGVVRLRFKADVEDYDEVRELAEEFVESGADNGGTGSAGQGSGDVPEYDASAASGNRPGASSGDKESGGTAAKVKNERICFEAVSWRDYRHGPAKRWEDRPWEAYRHAIPMEDLETFADKAITDAQTLPEDKLERGDTDNDVVVWEVWDKKHGKVRFIEQDTGKQLKVVPDPLGLTKFFPSATPMQPIEITGRLMPVNPYAIYRKLADELDTTTRRIAALTNQMKVRGWYAGGATDLANIIEADDNDWVPIADAEIWAQHGGLANAVAFWPIEKFILALRELYTNRNETKQAIYEITGISDIVRGATKATETLGAQQIKSQWGSLRIQKMQRMMERAARDLFVMMAEIIPAKFTSKTLQAMTGIQLEPTPQDQQPVPMPPQPPAPEEGTTPEQAQQMLQQYQQASQQAQELEQKRQKKLAHIQAVNTLLNDRVVSNFRIDVESDSTVRADLTQKKQEQAEFLQGTAAYFQGVAPMVESGVMSQEGALEIYAATARLFTLGKSTEDALEREIANAKEQAGKPKPPSPEQIKAEADAERAKAEGVKANAEAQAMQGEGLQKLMEAKSKADEEATQRQIKVQEAQDASAGRQQDIADKAALAELTRTTQAEKHTQDMELGRLNIILLERKIGQTEVATQATVATANAKIDQANVSTDNSIRTTDAGVEATKAKAAAKPKGDK